MLKQLSPIGALFALFEGREIPLPSTGFFATLYKVLRDSLQSAARGAHNFCSSIKFIS